MAIYNVKLSNILYDWQLSMASFRFCETYLLHIRPFVVNKSAISPFFGGCACIYLFCLHFRRHCQLRCCRSGLLVCKYAYISTYMCIYLYLCAFSAALSTALPSLKCVWIGTSLHFCTQIYIYLRISITKYHI